MEAACRYLQCWEGLHPRRANSLPRNMLLPLQPQLLPAPCMGLFTLRRAYLRQVQIMQRTADRRPPNISGTMSRETIEQTLQALRQYWLIIRLQKLEDLVLHNKHTLNVFRW